MYTSQDVLDTGYNFHKNNSNFTLKERLKRNPRLEKKIQSLVIASILLFGSVSFVIPPQQAIGENYQLITITNPETGEIIYQGYVPKSEPAADIDSGPALDEQMLARSSFENFINSELISNSVFDIEILNEQSYPTVGGEWIVEFTTKGTGDLVISGIDGTTFGESLPNDLNFFELNNGESSLLPIVDGNSVIFRNYSSESVGFFSSTVLTTGKHHLEFRFGNDVAYANNFASDGTVKSHQKISDTEGGFTGVLDDTDQFGFPVASLGDLDGDGVTDLAVGAVNDDDGGPNRGAVWILFLNADGTVKSHQKISDIDGGFTGVLDDSDLFGAGVASLGDLDGDGVTDLAVGVNVMTVPASETAPPDTAVTAVMDRASFSGSVSFERSSDAAMSSGVSSAVVRTDGAETVAVVSSTAVGATLVS